MQQDRPLRQVLAGHAASPLPATALCDLVLERIAMANERLGALTDVLHASARQEARRVEADSAGVLRAGRLAGMPVVIKDNIDTVPARCCAGLPFLSDHQPRTDACVVARLREEGAVIVGVAATDSGAFGVVTPDVVNPLWPDRIAGGSSGGSAAAVAAGLCLAALGTDTGGSVRIPAACCGVVGFKPSFARVSTEGVRPLAPSFDHVGVLAGCVSDARALCEVIDARFERPAPHEAIGTVIGHPTSFYADADDEVRHTMAEVLDQLCDMGCVIQEIDLPGPDEVVPVHLVLSLIEAARVQVDREGGSVVESYPQAARQSLLLGRSYSVSEWLEAIAQQREIVARIERAIAAVDFVVLPTLPVAVPKTTQATATLGGKSLSVLEVLIRYTAPFNQSGHPAIALPWCSPAARSPASVQIVGPAGSDARLLSFAQALEARAPGGHRPPSPRRPS